MILILLLYAILAASFTIGKMLLVFLPPIFLTAVRMTIAGTILLGVWYIFSRDRVSFQRGDIVKLIGLSVIHILIPYVAEFVALGSIAPSCAALMFNLTPFFSALFSYFYFGECMTLKKWLGFAIGLGGIGWFVMAESADVASVSFSTAYLLMLMAVISGSLGWVYFRKLVQQGYSPLQINGFAMLLAGLQSFGLSALFEGHITFAWDQWQQFLFLLMTIIILANFLFYNLYGYLLKRYTATLLSFIGCVTPLFTAVFDYLWLDIAVNAQFFIVILVVGSGIYLFYQEELRQGYVS